MLSIPVWVLWAATRCLEEFLPLLDPYFFFYLQLLLRFLNLNGNSFFFGSFLFPNGMMPCLQIKLQNLFHNLFNIFEVVFIKHSIKEQRIYLSSRANKWTYPPQFPPSYAMLNILVSVSNFNGFCLFSMTRILSWFKILKVLPISP